MLLGPEPELAVLGLQQAVQQWGWAGAVLTHIGNLLLQQADHLLAASYHLDVQVDHSSAMTEDGTVAASQEAEGHRTPGTGMGHRALEGHLGSQPCSGLWQQNPQSEGLGLSLGLGSILTSGLQT